VHGLDSFEELEKAVGLMDGQATHDNCRLPQKEPPQNRVEVLQAVDLKNAKGVTATSQQAQQVSPQGDGEDRPTWERRGRGKKCLDHGPAAPVQIFRRGGVGKPADSRRAEWQSGGGIVLCNGRDEASVRCHPVHYPANKAPARVAEIIDKAEPVIRRFG